MSERSGEIHKGMVGVKRFEGFGYRQKGPIPGGPPPTVAPVVYTELHCPGRGCASIVSGRWTDPDRALADHGWTPAPKIGIRIDVGVRLFRPAHRVFQSGIDGALHGTRMVVVAPSEVAPVRDGTIWLWNLPANTSIDTLCEQLGVKAIETPFPEILAGIWCCSPACIASRLQSETIGSREVVSTKDPPTSKPEAQSTQVKCAHCSGTVATAAAATLGDPAARAKLLRDSGAVVVGKNTYCGKTCFDLSAMTRGDHGVTKALTRADLAEKYGGEKYLPTSMAEAEYVRIHGHGPAEAPPESPSTEATPLRPARRGR